MKKRMLAIMLGLSLSLGLLGCGETASLDPYETEMEYELEESEENEETENYYKEPTEERPAVVEKTILKQGINRFGFSMYDRLSDEENCFYSPYSLCSALSLLDLGAGSKTKEELEETLGIEDLDAWKWAMRDYLGKEWSESTYLLTANAVWMDKNKKWSENIEENFLAPAMQFFNGTVKEKNFENPSDVIADVNTWADKNTKGMIKKVLNELDPNAKMILANAVYFDGKWDKPFEEDKTKETIFNGKNGDSQIKGMNQYGSYYSYYSDEKVKGISVPYKDSIVVMKIFIPQDKSIFIGDIIGNMSAEERQGLVDALDFADRKEISRFMLPKFEFEQELKGLDGILQDMGIRDAYMSDADLDKIAEDLYVSTVIHKAKIEVDEKGTKAAAVTVIVAKDNCAMPIESYVDFVVDCPFFFVIEDTDTGVILFMGQINDLP